MPVSTGSLGEPRAKRCKHCDESSHRSESGSGYWQLQLDRDLVETISAIYPDWFKSSMAEGVPPAMAPARESPPKAVVDTSPLLNSLEQNKESLKVKLMLRRPVEQLRAQGIMPPLKTPAAFHGQRRQLERAKTGDLLKTKIQQRPSRLELESRHILEADPHVDPSLAEKQRMLKKARLADQLNDQLSHRPGPLELIQKNILHTEEPIEHAVKAGHIPYRATCEGQFNRPQHPLSYVTPEEDSQSSEDNVTASPVSVDMLETAAKSAGIVVSLLPASEGAVVVTTSSSVLNKDNSEIFADLCRSVAAPLLNQASSPASLSLSSTSTLSPLSSIASPAPSQPPTPAPVTLTPRPIPSPVRTDAPGKDKNRKKSKSKAIPKTRTIKFHEYKGPPSAQKSSSPNNPSPGESSYDLLLQQQTLLLQFQLQLQHKYPQIILPAQKNIENTSTTNPVPSPAPSDSSLSTRLIGRLEDMKVSDLKAELKRRNLPVSGSKPQLIERLKTNMSNGDCSIASGGDDSSHNSPQHTDVGSPGLAEDQEHMEMDPQSPQILHCDLKTQEELVRDQQRKIEELQRELTLSQMKLQAATRAEPKAQCLALKKHLQAKQQQQPMVIQMQQMLQSEEQAKIQQQQHVAFQNQKNLNGNLVLNRNDAALVLNHLVQGRNKLKNNTRANSLPNFINSIVVEAAEEKPPPPIYEEAIKKENSIKSQTVDDVLEILIKNGELPPSAAQDPLTPNSVKAEPPYPINETPESALGLDAADLLNTLDTLETMDFTQLIELGAQPQTNNNSTVPMDTDDWLESLLPSEINVNNNHQDLGYDPLMGIAPDPFDPFCLEDFRNPTELSWGDKVDFAA